VRITSPLSRAESVPGPVTARRGRNLRSTPPIGRIDLPSHSIHPNLCLVEPGMCPRRRRAGVRGCRVCRSNNCNASIPFSVSCVEDTRLHTVDSRCSDTTVFFLESRGGRSSRANRRLFHGRLASGGFPLRIIRKIRLRHRPNRSPRRQLGPRRSRVVTGPLPIVRPEVQSSLHALAGV